MYNVAADGWWWKEKESNGPSIGIIGIVFIIIEIY
jgi:hypothetical protein